MITVAHNNQLERYRNLLLSKGYKINQQKEAIRADSTICSNGKVWIATSLSTNSTIKNDDLGRMLRSSI